MGQTRGPIRPRWTLCWPHERCVSQAIVRWTIGSRFQWDYSQCDQTFYQEHVFENVVCKMSAILLRPQSVKSYPTFTMCCMIWSIHPSHFRLPIVICKYVGMRVTCLCVVCQVWHPGWTMDLQRWNPRTDHYDDVIMGTIASQITSLTIVYSALYSGADQSKHQSSASLAFVWRIHRGPVNSPHKWPVTRKMSPFDDVIMTATGNSCCISCSIANIQPTD